MFKIGEPVEVIKSQATLSPGNGNKKMSVYRGQIVQLTDKFAVVNLGKFNECFDLKEIRKVG